MPPQVTYYRIKDFNKLNNYFLKYYFSFSEFQNLFNSWAGGGSTRAYLGIQEQKKLPILIPPIDEQREIAFILRTLDDKIALNHTMNSTLEAIGQSIFKQWFVDFEFPNEEGKPYKPSGGDLVDSELGEIPKGWEITKIGDAVNVVGGGTPSTKISQYWDGGIFHWATPKDLSRLSSCILLDTERKVTKSGLSQISSGLLPKGTVLLSSRAPIGYLAISYVPIAVNQGFIAMVCESKLSNYYVLNWTFANMDIIKRYSSGTTFQEINKRNFRPLPILKPSQEILNEFTRLAKLIYENIAGNLQETEYLSTIRDSLLPKLMSGEIRINVPEKEVGAIA